MNTPDRYYYLLDSQLSGRVKGGLLWAVLSFQPRISEREARMDDPTQRIAHPTLPGCNPHRAVVRCLLMVIGERLRELREAKKISQGEIEKRTGLLRCYVSRVENGHTVPNLETLEKWARAFDMPLYQLLYEGEEPPKPLKLTAEKVGKLWGSSSRQTSELDRLRRNLAKIDETHRKTLLALASRMARRSRSK